MGGMLRDLCPAFLSWRGIGWESHQAFGDGWEGGTAS